eukprot:931004-Prymnesium_polylepis.1
MRRKTARVTVGSYQPVSFQGGVSLGFVEATEFRIATPTPNLHQEIFRVTPQPHDGLDSKVKALA